VRSTDDEHAPARFLAGVRRQRSEGRADKPRVERLARAVSERPRRPRQRDRGYARCSP
jgi:hypothetical protein